MVTPPFSKQKKLPPWMQRGLNWTGNLGHPVVLSTLGASAIVLGLRTMGALQGLELGAYDQILRLRPTPPADERLLVVGIDEADIQSRQEWPIQDTTITDLLSVLLAAEPRAIGLDMFRDVPIGQGQAALLQQIQNNDGVFPVCKISSPDTPGVPPPEGTPLAQVSFSDLLVDQGGILRRSLLVTSPPPDAKGVGDHICSDPNVQLLSLSMQLSLRYLAAKNITLETTPQGNLKLGDTVLPRLSPNLGGYRKADDRGYQLMLNYRSARSAVPQVSLTDVLNGTVTPDQIRDRIVLIGATTPEAKDDFYTPFSGGLEDSQKMPGVIVHAQSTSQILSAVLDGRPLLWSWSTAGETVWIVAWGLVGAFFAWQISRPVIYALGAGVLILVLYGACYGLLLQGGWIPVIPPTLALFLASGGVVLLDRFNKSDYGQSVYKQMKSLLRLEIEIDKDKVGQQVAEITDTEYFNKLQAQARELRQKKERSLSFDPASGSGTVLRQSAPRPEEVQGEASVDDYLDTLKRKAQNLKQSDADSSPQP